MIPDLLRASPLSRIVVTTGLDSARAAVAALQAGARHYLVKPFEIEELLLVVERQVRAVAFAENRKREERGDVFWGDLPEMGMLRSRLVKLAEAPLTPVLIEAETGAGKEVVARELHRLTKPQGPFVPLNCAAVPAELLESELFGHERGAFTGAVARQRGVVELAADGTLFLDEVAEMAPALQAKLLRFLEDRSFRRVGGQEQLTSRCRVVAATHRDLAGLRAEGRFRDDLFYRLAVVRLGVPPLRARGDDVIRLAYFLLDRLAGSLGRRPPQLSPQAEALILDHRWPGNVRELRNRLERALVLGERAQIEPADLDLPVVCAVCRARDCRCRPESTAAVEAEEAARLSTILCDEGWNLARAARRLGVERHWLKYRIRKYGLTRPQ
jgi:DNA-binding NtrC family response regulator